MPSNGNITTLDQLTPDPKNARKHGEHNLNSVVASLQEVGAARSIVIDEDGVVLAGNATIAAAKAAGFTKLKVVDTDEDTLVAVRRTGLTPARKNRLALLDNRTAELAEWDSEMLSQLADEGIDMSDLWTDEDWKALIAAGEPKKEDPKGGGDDFDATPTEGPTTCQSGQLWALGKHRLLCGDSTKAEDVARLMGGAKAALCLTDPPYGVGWDYESTDDTASNLQVLIDGFLPLARSRSDVVLVTTGNMHHWLYPRPEWTLCWFVAAGTGSGPWGFTCWQPILAYGKDPFLARGMGSRPDGMSLVEAAPNDTGHPCPKPLGVWQWFVERGSVAEGDIVYDPFLGSGTTLIAAQRTGRICYGMEIAPKYCDVVVKRYEAETGEKATLLEDARG